VYASVVDPTPGQAALVRSGAVWGTVFTALTFTIAPSWDVEQTYLRLGAGSDLGTLVGASLAPGFRGSRLQVNCVNLGGYAGLTLGGVASLILSSQDIYDEPVHVTAAALTTALGLTIGGLIARDIQRDRSRPRRVTQRRLSVTPPLPTVVPQPDGSLGVRVTLSAVGF